MSAVAYGGSDCAAEIFDADAALTNGRMTRGRTYFDEAANIELKTPFDKNEDE
jgi:hypothetical protein